LSQTASRVHGLDTLRSLAIVSVIVFHIYVFHGAASVPAMLLPAVKMGWMGVDLFFVLSGYLIGSQLLRPYLADARPRLWTFYRNRFYRVLPAYLVVLLLYCVLPAWREFPHLAPLWQFLSFTQNLTIDYRIGQSFSHAWSLCVEEHFYLLLPLIVLITMRRPSLRKATILLVGLVLVGIGIRAYFVFAVLQPLARGGHSYVVSYMEHIYYPTYSHFDGLLAGVTLALIKTFRPRWWSALARRGHLLTVTAVVLLAVAVWLCRDRLVSTFGVSACGMVIGFPILSLALGLLVASSLSDNGLLSRCKVPGSKLIATLAYSLYLTSKELLHLVDRCFPFLAKMGIYPWLVVYAVSCLLVAAALYLCVERPFLILRDKRGAARTISTRSSEVSLAKC